MRAQTFTWVIVPKGKRIKTILPLDERLFPYPDRFAEKVGARATMVFMRTEMAEGWKGDTVLGLTIHRLNKNYPLYHYTFAVTKKDFTDIGGPLDVSN